MGELRASFSPCGRRWREAPDEGSVSAETDPSSGYISLRSISPPSPTRGEGKEDTYAAAFGKR